MRPSPGEPPEGPPQEPPAPPPGDPRASGGWRQALMGGGHPRQGSTSSKVLGEPPSGPM